MIASSGDSDRSIDTREPDNDIRIRPPRQQIRELIAHRPNTDRRTRLTVILERALRRETTDLAFDIGDAFTIRIAFAVDAGIGMAGRIKIREPRIVIEHFTDLDIRERALGSEPVNVETSIIEATRVTRDNAFRRRFRWFEHVFECTPKHKQTQHVSRAVVYGIGVADGLPAHARAGRLEGRSGVRTP